jgi:hypothetical protein
MPSQSCAISITDCCSGCLCPSRFHCAIPLTTGPKIHVFTSHRSSCPGTAEWRHCRNMLFDVTLSLTSIVSHHVVDGRGIWAQRAAAVERALPYDSRWPSYHICSPTVVLPNWQSALPQAYPSEVQMAEVVRSYPVC